ncbi:MAG: rhamnulokinase family protein [bacterium]
MKEQYRFLAIDLGAGSGRVILGTLSNGKISLQELHRFETGGITILDTLQWDYTRIYAEIINGLIKYRQMFGAQLDGIAIDTWGVDFGLIARDGTVLGNPIHYRDKRTVGIPDLVYRTISPEKLYRETGIQHLPFNTIFQLYSMVHTRSPILAAADSMLLMGDLFAYLLCGKRACEYTNASTTQLLDLKKKTWNEDLIYGIGIPRNLLLDIVQPGTVLGPILPEIAKQTGLDATVPVIAPASHDTASAIAAIPVTSSKKNWAYISSGTWSLLGTELDSPIINQDSYQHQFTNEAGVDNKICFLKNISGLWLVQECRNYWNRQSTVTDYAKLTQEAESAAPLQAIIDVNDSKLLAPENMPEMIQQLCREIRLRRIPETKGEIIRCALESLAYQYKQRIQDLDTILGRKTELLHIVGGGVQNRLLSQLASDACGIPVIAGPVEATTIGNIIVQAIALGGIKSLAAARQIIAQSFEVTRFEPKNTEAWKKLVISS